MTSHERTCECFTLVPSYGRDDSGHLLRDSGLQIDEIEKTETVTKVYKQPTQYNNSMPSKDIFCFDDSKSYGEYFSLDLDVWEQIDYFIDDHKRINLRRLNASKEVRIFVQTDKTIEPKTCHNLVNFDRGGWAELRRVRGDKKGLPLETNQNGTIWIGDRFLNCDLQIYTRRSQ